MSPPSKFQSHFDRFCVRFGQIPQALGATGRKALETRGRPRDGPSGSNFSPRRSVSVASLARRPTWVDVTVLARSGGWCGKRTTGRTGKMQTTEKPTPENDSYVEIKLFKTIQRNWPVENGGRPSHDTYIPPSTSGSESNFDSAFYYCCYRPARFAFVSFSPFPSEDIPVDRRGRHCRYCRFRTSFYYLFSNFTRPRTVRRSRGEKFPTNGT